MRTLNNFWEIDRVAYDRNIISACKGERATLYWNSFEDAGEKSWTLSTSSPESFSPPLVSRQLAATGTLDVTVLGDAELKLSSQVSKWQDGFLEVRLIPELLCTGFGFPLIGWYTGTLEQTSPETKTLSRYLRLTYHYPYVDAPAELRLGIAEDLNFSHGRFAPCELEQDSSRLTCFVEVDTGSSFSVDAIVTEAGLEGTYKDVQVREGTFTTVEGKLAFTKQPGLPPG